MALLTGDRRIASESPTGVRLPLVPTQRPPLASPSPRTLAGEPTPVASRPTRRRGPKVAAVVVTAVLALGVGTASAVVTVQQDAHRAEVVRQRMALTVAAAAADAALDHRVDVAAAVAARTARAAEMAARSAAIGRAAPQVEAARGVLGASPQASPESRAALQAAVDSAAGMSSADVLPLVEAMDAAAAALAGPMQAVAESQAAWQAAEEARAAAEAAAATARAAAAQQAGAAAQRPSAAAQPTTGAGRTPTPARAGGAPAQAPAAAAAAGPAAAAPAPAAAAPAGGVPEFSAGAVGDAINAHRVANGLSALSVSRSGTLYAHASAMAEAGSIWHGGSDKIVGYVKPGSASSLVKAWAASPGHNAWMLRDGVSSMQVGAALLNGRLYGAVDFR